MESVNVNESKLKRYLRSWKVRFFIMLVLALIACIMTGYTIYNARVAHQQLATDVGKIATLQKQLNDANTALDAEKKASTSRKAASQLAIDDLQAKLDAFAKQAASCDRIKKKLNIKGE